MERYRLPDILRGIAILGILPVNLRFYGLPASAPHRPPGADGLDVAAIYGVDALFIYQFLSIFALLLGFGIETIRRRCVARGQAFGAVMVRRLLTLAAFGTLHILLLWYGDILLAYALTGLVVFLAARSSTRLLRVTGIVLVLIPIPLIMTVSLWWSMFGSPQTAAPATVPVSMETLREAVHGPWGAYVKTIFTHFSPQLETVVYREGVYLRQVVLRLATSLTFIALAPLIVPRIAGLFLLGMTCARAEWFVRPADHRAVFRALAAWGFVIGVPIQATATWLAVTRGGATATALVVEGLQFAASLGTTAGYIGLAGLALAAWPTARWLGAVEAIGRMSLSNYIFQSLLCTTLFYSYGLALFGRFDHAQLFLLALAVWVVQLIGSPLWLRRFRTGPLEYLWRRLTYGK